ncbi:MAG: cation-translocating P-type ATPase [Clostridia bacterium]
MQTISKESVLTLLKTSPMGLGFDESKIRQNIQGKNSLGEKRKQSLFIKFLLQFKNLMVIILLISAVISISLAFFKKQYSDLIEGLVILLIVFLNAFIGVIQEKKAENAIEKLNSSMEAFCYVYRDGKVVKCKTIELVTGDIVSLHAGDIVPADIRLIETTSLKTNESSITGESEQVFKDEEFIASSNTLFSECKNMVYSGTIVTFGHGKGVVTAIGKSTEIGKIASMLESNTKKITPLEKSIGKISRITSIAVVIIAIFIFFIQVFISKQTNILSAFMTSVALAVAAIPESLPAVITIIMALGVERLAKHNAIVRKLSAVETLGSCTLIASDKTGTITKNKLSVCKVFTGGKVKLIEEVKARDETSLFTFISLCNAVEFEENGVVGNNVDVALAELAIKKGVNIENTRKKYEKISEIPFDSKRKTMLTIHKMQSSSLVIEKGAVDYLLKKCDKININGKIEKFSKEYYELVCKNQLKFAEDALRVIAVCYKEIGENDSLEKGFTFLALLAMFDPPREEVKDAISKCFKAGLKPVMITGDHAETAFAIGKKVGICSSRTEILTGEQLSVMNDAELSKIICKYSIFARVVPEHKARIVKAFQKNGHIVAMTGDGVNDAPSIKCADIGVGMGQNGTDVTKMVSDIVLSDDNFATLVVAIEEGRKVYSNISKTVQFLLGTNAVEVISMFVCILLFPGLIFLFPVQILFINLVTDSLPAFALGLEEAEDDSMTHPPRKSTEHFLSGRLGFNILYQSLLQSLIVIIVYISAINHFDNFVASTMVFYVIIYMQWLHSLNCRSNKSLFDGKIKKNKVFNLCFFITFLLNLSVSVLPFMINMFSLATLNWTQWLTIITASISIIPAVEIVKLISPIKNNKKLKNAFI